MFNAYLGGFTYLELLNQGIIDFAAHRSENTSLSEGSIQDLLDGNRAWNAD